MLPAATASKTKDAGGASSKEQEKEIASLMEAFKDVQARHARARAEELRRRSLLPPGGGGGSTN